jgi:hypothetical protein
VKEVCNLDGNVSSSAIASRSCLKASAVRSVQESAEYKYLLHLDGSAKQDGEFVQCKDALPELLACVMQTVTRYKENIGALNLCSSVLLSQGCPR